MRYGFKVFEEFHAQSLEESLNAWQESKFPRPVVLRMSLAQRQERVILVVHYGQRESMEKKP